MDNKFLQRYGFRAINEENYITKDYLLVTSVVSLNNCSIRAITMYDKGKTIREKFFIDEVNGKKNNKDLSEEQRNIWNNLEAKAKLDRFNNPDCEKIRTEEAFDKFMEELDALTSFLSIAIE